MSGTYATWPSGVVEVSVGRLFADQLFTTSILVLTVLAVTDPNNANPKGLAPLIIGLTVAALALSFGSNGGFVYKLQKYLIILQRCLQPCP